MKRNLLVFTILSIFCFGCHSDNVQYTWNLCGNNTINYENTDFVIDGYHNFFDGLDCAKEQNKPILVFFHAHHMAGQSFETKILANSKVQKLLKDNFVPIVLYTDDRSSVNHLDMDKFSETLPMTTALDKEIRNLGNLNAAIQLELAFSNSQPTFLAITHDGKLLGNIIGYKKKDLFSNWLEASLANFKADNFLFDIM